MPLTPLQFDTLEHLQESLRRLEAHQLLSLHNSQAVITTERLATELLVEESGDTYLLSELLANSEENEALSKLKFIDKKTGQKVTLQEIKESSETVCLHNRPLAEALSTLRISKNHYAVDLKATRLFPFPMILPMITQDETSEDLFKATQYREFCIKRKRENPYPILLPNHALDELNSGANKSTQQKNDYADGLLSLENDISTRAKNVARYKNIMKEYPALKNKSHAEQLEYLNQYKHRYKRRVKIAKPLLTSGIQVIGIVGGMILGAAAAGLASMLLGLLGITNPVIGLAVIAISMIPTFIAVITSAKAISNFIAKKFDKKSRSINSAIETLTAYDVEKHKNDEILVSKFKAKKAAFEKNNKIKRNKSADLHEKKSSHSEIARPAHKQNIRISGHNNSLYYNEKKSHITNDDYQKAPTDSPKSLRIKP